MIPPGLRRCETCGELRGTFSVSEAGVPTSCADVTVTCICDGIPCGRCGTNPIRRPITNHYDEQTGRVWHTPYFGHLIHCDTCRAADAERRAERR